MFSVIVKLPPRLSLEQTKQEAYITNVQQLTPSDCAQRTIKA